MSKPITIIVEGFQAERVEQFIAEQIAAADNEHAGRLLQKALEEHVEKVAEEYTRKKLAPLIDAVIAEGWTETNTYGEPTGKRYTARDRIRAFFDAKENHYSGSRESRVERWIRESADRELATALKDEVAKARAALKAAFDEVLKAKFAETLRTLLGG